MPNSALTIDEALDRLTVAARNGNRAKRRLAAKLAAMTPVQLRKVKPEAFARLGPAGLQLFAIASRTMRTVELAPTKTARLAKPEKLDGPRVRARRWWHFAHPLAKCLVVMTVCGVLGGAAARLGQAAVDHFVSRQAEMISGWPVCGQLDPAADRCVYRTMSDTLTIDRIVAMTGIPDDVLVASNRHLDLRHSLSRGSLVVIPSRRHDR
jgi:hypothetical protein